MYPLGMTDSEHEDFMRWSLSPKGSDRIRNGGSRSGLFQYEESFEDCAPNGAADIRRRYYGVSSEDCVCSGGDRMPVGMWDREDYATAAV